MVLLLFSIITIVFGFSIFKLGTKEKIENVAESNSESIELFSKNRLIVKSNSEKFKTFGGKVESKNGNIYVLSFNDEQKFKDAYEKLKDSHDILSVEKNQVLKTGLEGDYSSKYDEIPVSKTELAAFLRSKEEEKEIIVAVLDTGINPNNVSYDKIIDLNLNYSNSGEKDSIFDDNGHGTELAKIILENSNNNIKIMPIKVADSEGNSSVYQTYLGFKAAMENGADIINISMNSYNTKESKVLEEIINEANEKGIKVVVSSGNDKIDTKYAIPSNIDKAIVVGAVAENNLIERYSNFGEQVDYSAYGMYENKSGTSYAAARVTGILADAMSKNLGEEVLEEYAIDLGEKGKDKYFGNGFIGLMHNDIDENTIPNDYFESSIFEKDWKNMTTEELDEVIDNTEKYCLAIFLQNQNEEDLKLIKSKSNVLRAFYSIDDEENENNQTYFDYLLNTKIDSLMKTSASISYTVRHYTHNLG